jgi:hypothetical protein
MDGCTKTPGCRFGLSGISEETQFGRAGNAAARRERLRFPLFGCWPIVASLVTIRRALDAASRRAVWMTLDQSIFRALLETLCKTKKQKISIRCSEKVETRPTTAAGDERKCCHR